MAYILPPPYFGMHISLTLGEFNELPKITLPVLQYALFCSLRERQKVILKPFSFGPQHIQSNQGEAMESKTVSHLPSFAEMCTT